MIDLNALVSAADDYAKNINRSRVTVSKRLFGGDALALDRLAQGRTCTVKNYNKAHRILQELISELENQRGAA